MGTPAARLMDPTVHGGMIVAGMPTVLIGGMPAARIGDMHVCPLVNVLVPHVGGPLVLGAFTTLVGGPPQSRQGDMAICVGPPDAVMMGCPTVLVGMAPAAGAMSVIVAGALAGLANFLGESYPKAVLAADGKSFETQYNSSVTIQGSPEYQATVVNDLNKFTGTDTGKKWNEAYAVTGKRVTIAPVPAAMDQANAFATPASTDAYPSKGPVIAPGKGSDSTVNYNPSLVSEYTGEDGKTYTMEPHQTLGHELVHSLHNAEGENLQRQSVAPPIDNEEEARTIGTHGFESPDSSQEKLKDLNARGFRDRGKISERQLELEEGQSPRPDHNSVTHDVWQDSDGVWRDRKWNPETAEWEIQVIPAPDDAAARPNH